MAAVQPHACRDAFFGESAEIHVKRELHVPGSQGNIKMQRGQEGVATRF